MKLNVFFLIIIFFGISINACKTGEKSANSSVVYQDSLVVKSGDKMTIILKNGDAFNHPTYVIWKEDMNGNYIETIFITESYASGIFGHQMLGDSVWLDQKGSSYQPAALPYWTFKKGPIDEKYMVPTPEHPFVDAYAGATPSGDFQFMTTTDDQLDQYRLLLEVNQAWDWDKYWTNDKYPDSDAYKHSAQPSVIYAVRINLQDSLFYLNPIGHGDPTGVTGKLFTDISTLSTAKQIFQTVTISITR